MSVGIQFLETYLSKLEQLLLDSARSNSISLSNPAHRPPTGTEKVSDSQGDDVVPYRSESDNNSSTTPIHTSTSIPPTRLSLTLTEPLAYFFELKSLMSDISTSCESSVLILDDLLLYDKIETGNLSLRYERVAFMDYLVKWVKTYRLQVSLSKSI